MAIPISDNILSNSAKSLDAKYSVFASGVTRAYSSISEANSTIPAAYRAIGQTVLINNGSANVEYWYQAGIADGNLIPKAIAYTATSPVSIVSNVIAIQQANTSQAGYLTATDWNTFNTKVATVGSIGAGTYNIYSGTTSGAVSIKTLTAGTNVTITDTSNILTVASASWSGTNLGSGSQLYVSVAGTALQLRSLTAGGGITLTQNTNDVNVAVTGSVATSSTTTVNNTPTVIASVPITNESAGILEVTMISVVVGAAATCATSRRYVNYYKTGGTLTIMGTITDLIPETKNTLTTASWTIVANNSTNNFDITVTGQTSVTLKWLPTVKNSTNS